MAKHEEQAAFPFDNFELKRWLHGNKCRRRRLLVKLKDDLRQLGLSRRKTREGLLQLAIKPHVILKRLSVSYHGKKSLCNVQNPLLFHQKDTQRKHRDDIEEKRRRKENSRDIPQQSDTQIPNAATGTASISAVDASKSCSSKIEEECNLSRERKRSLDDTIQNCTQKATKKVSHIDVVSANCRNISAEKSDIKAAPSSSSSEDESSRKRTQSFRQLREQRRKKMNDKIKKKREKLRKYFRGDFDAGTSESEEECKILQRSYLRKNKQESNDLDDTITEEEIACIFKKKNKLTPTSADNLQKDMESAVLTEEQHMENSSSIIDTENNSKSDAHAEPNKDIPSMITTDLDKNMGIENIHLNQNVEKEAETSYTETNEVNRKQEVLEDQQENEEMHSDESSDLAQSRNVQKHTTSNLKLPFMSESISCNVDEKDGCDTMQNSKNLFLRSNITKGEEKIDQLSMTETKTEENFPEKINDNSLFIHSSNPSTLNKSNSSGNHSLDGHLADDDNGSDIEIEIKIKPKLKSRVLQKFSLKAPWSAVNTCIKSLHTFKDNPSVLNELFQMNKTSEKSKHCTTSKEDNTSLDGNRSVTFKTKEIIREFNPISEGDVKDSPQNFQDSTILNKDSHVVDHNKKGRDEHEQSVKQKEVTTEYNLESSKVACDTSNLAEQLQKDPTDDKQKTNEEQNSRHNEGTRSAIEHNQGEEVECLSSVKKMQIAAENRSGSVSAADNLPDVEKQLPQTSLDAHRKVRVRSIAELSCQCSMKSMNLNLSIPRTVCSAFCQSTTFQSAPQSASLQPTHSPLMHPQLTSQLAPNIPSQLAPQSASFQSACPRLLPPQSVPQLESLQSTLPHLISSQLAFSQSTPCQSTPLQSTHPQLISPQLAPSKLVPPQSAHTRLTSPQSITPQSITNRPPPYDIIVDHLYASRNTNASVEINGLNDKNDLIYSIQFTVRNVCIYFANCRKLTSQCRILGRYSSEYIQRIQMYLKLIKKDLINLKELLHINDIENIITYINQHVPSSQPLTTMEYHNYTQIVQSHLHYSAQILQQSTAKSNVLPYPNVGGLVPGASMSDVNAQPSFLRNATLPDASISNRSKFMQSSTAPRPAPMIPNIQQQQSIASLANSTQVPQSRQPPIKTNIRQQYPSYVPPPTLHSRISNVSQQKFLGNANYPIQGQYMPSADMSNVGIQQGFVNMSNVSSSNTNMHSREPVNQGRNTNVPPTSSRRQSNFKLQTNIINNTATVSAAKSQQQKQINLVTTICQPSATKQNIPFGTHQNVHNVLPGSFTVNSENTIPRTNAAMRSVNYERANVNQCQTSCSSQVPQASSETTQSLPHVQIAARPNEIYFLLVSQLACSNMQTHPVQNTLLDQGVRQIPQQNWLVNQGNVPPTTSATHVTSTNTISRSVHLSINDTSQQNVQQNVPNKGAEIGRSQNKNCMQKKPSSTNPQQNVRQGIPSVQNIPGTVPVRLCVLQNTMSKVSLRKKGLDILPLPILARLQNPESINDFNLTILTEIQKIVLRDQIQSYFIMLDELRHSLNEQQFKQISYERLILLYFYLNLDDYVNNIIPKSQTTKPVEKNSQDNTSQNKPALQENTVQTSVDTLTKTQSSQHNESNSACNKNLEKQSSDPNISKNSTTIRSNLETSNKESLFMPKSAITREPLPKDTRLKEQELSKTPEVNSITEVFTNNSETKTQDNAKINESLESEILLDKLFPELRFLLTQSPLNLLQDVEMEDQLKIAKNNANENSSNVRMGSVHKISNVAILNSSGKNNTTSRASCNPEDQDKKVHNASNEISRENLQDVRENAKVLNSTKTQSQLGTAHEKEHFETISELCLNAQQEDPTYHERSDYSTDEMSDCSGKLYIDESMEEQNDKISSSEEDNLCTLQDSTRLVDTIRSDSTQVTSSLPENTPKTDLFNECQDFIANDVEKRNEEPSLEAEKMQLEDTSLKLDKWNVISVIQSIGNIKNQDAKEENSELSLLQAEAIEFQKAFTLEAPENISSNEEILMNSSYLMKNFLEDVEEEKMEINAHNKSKAIDEHVPDWRCGKSPTSSCSSVQKDDPVDVNVKEFFAENNVLKADTVECIPIENDDSSEFAETVPSIFNIRSISPSLFDTIEDDTDDRPCLRCKRKSIVYCQACLEAHYCSKRCSSLHWIAEHYRQCKGHNSIIYIDD